MGTTMVVSMAWDRVTSRTSPASNSGTVTEVAPLAVHLASAAEAPARWLSDPDPAALVAEIRALATR